MNLTASVHHGKSHANLFRVVQESTNVRLILNSNKLFKKVIQNDYAYSFYEKLASKA